MLKEQLNLTVAIVRTYNFAGIGEFVQKLLNFGIRHVVVVVPHEQDKGVTAPILASFDRSRVHLVIESFEKGGQAWSAMLNLGLDYIETFLDDDFIDYVLTVSNTVLLEIEHLDRLYAEVDVPLKVAAGAKFKGVGNNGEEVPLGISYNHHLRNTLALYRFEVFGLHSMTRRFDESSDGKCGMEDLVMKRMIERYGHCKVAEGVVEVPLLVYTHRTPAAQAKYEALMERGIEDAEFHADHLAFLDR